MRKNFLRLLAYLLSFICIVLLCILIYMKTKNLNSPDKQSKLIDKVISEIDFMDYNVIECMNSLNNITMQRYKVYTKNINTKNNNMSSSNNTINENKVNNGTNESSENTQNSNTINNSVIYLSDSLTETDNQEINWIHITNIYENINNVWPTTMLDLKKASISDEYLENITVDLNGLAQSILNKDKNSSLINLYNLYSQFPYYLSLITKDQYKINLYNTKLAILNAYTLSNSENKWNEMSSSVRSARGSFEIILSMENTNINSKNNLEKINSMLLNLENSISLNNKNIFYMQYKNVMQELETI